MNAISLVIAAAALLFVLVAKMIPVVIAGSLAFAIACFLSEWLSRKLPSKYAKNLAAAAVSVVVAGTLVAIIFGAIKFVRDDGIDQMLQSILVIINQSRDTLPAQVLEFLPKDVDGIRAIAVDWIQDNSDHLTMITEKSLHTLVQVIIGIVIGVAASFSASTSTGKRKPLSISLHKRLETYIFSFKTFVSAQLRISLFNSVLTAIFIGFVLPLFDVRLPYFKTIILVTFIAGMLPIVGNLISNTLVVVISFGQSLHVAIAALVFLVVIHKFEYFISAKIISGTIESKIWEMLTAMLVMESVFGVSGLAFAPIAYTYLKSELKKHDLV